jgi:hypothetical protein
LCKKKIKKKFTIIFKYYTIILNNKYYNNRIYSFLYLIYFTNIFYISDSYNMNIYCMLILYYDYTYYINVWNKIINEENKKNMCYMMCVNLFVMIFILPFFR